MAGVLFPLMFAEVETSGLRKPVMSASQKGSLHTLTPTDPSAEATPSARLLSPVIDHCQRPLGELCHLKGHLGWIVNVPLKHRN